MPRHVYIQPPDVLYPSEVVARPKGNKRAFNETAITTTAAYQKVCEIVVANGKTFDLAYFSCCCDKDIWIRLLWGGDVITPEILVLAKSMPQFWVPSEYQKVVGDGTKKFELQVKWITFEGSAFGEIVGEEV